MAQQPHKILIAVDFSEPSEQAFEAGLALARDENADVVLVHAFPKRLLPMGSSEAGSHVVDKLEGEMDLDQAMRLSEDWAAKARKQGHTVFVEAGDGPAVNLILDVAKKHRVSVIVVGTHGRSGLKHLFLGSIAEQVLRQAAVPVLVVPWRKRDVSASEEE